MTDPINLFGRRSVNADILAQLRGVRPQHMTEEEAMANPSNPELLQEQEDEAFVIRTFRAWYANQYGHQGDGPQTRPDSKRRRRYS